MYTTQNVQTSSKKVRTLSRIRQNMAGLMVYNGGEEPAVLIHDGTYYTFPPDGSWMGPNDEAPREYDGVTEVRDVYGVSRELLLMARKRKSPDAFRQLPKDEVVATAVSIAERAERKLGPRGVVVLTGDDKLDAPLRKQAKDAWVAYRVIRAEQSVKNYRERTKSFYSDPRNNGHLPPSMTDFETGEQMFLDEYRSGMIGGRKYVCKYKCGFQHDDATVMSRHVKAAHPAAQDDTRSFEAMTIEALIDAKKRELAMLTAQAGVQMDLAATDIRHVAKRRGRPKKVAAPPPVAA